MKARREQQSVTDGEVWWTLERAALHLGVRRATVEKYVREGLALHWVHAEEGLFLKRSELLAEYGRRQASTRATRLKAKAPPL